RPQLRHARPGRRRVRVALRAALAVPGRPVRRTGAVRARGSRRRAGAVRGAAPGSSADSSACRAARAIASPKPSRRTSGPHAARLTMEYDDQPSWQQPVVAATTAVDRVQAARPGNYEELCADL